jgi:hypothetical protein
MNIPADPPLQVESWACPSCGASSTSPYCPACGERRRSEHDLTLRHLFEQLLESLIHFDGRLFRTTKVLVTQPGRLTTAYLAGSRRPYVSPFHIFLVANVVFFIVQVFSGLAVLTVPLATELDYEVYSGLAQRLVARHLAGAGMSVGQYAPIFDHAEGLYAKSLIMLMLPLFAVVAGLLFFDRRKVAVAHLVFAVHYYAFLLVVLCVLFPVFAILTSVLFHLGVHLGPGVLDWIATSAEALLCLTYLGRSSEIVYEAGPLRRWLSAGLLTVATLYILYAYRFILFMVTLLAT